MKRGDIVRTPAGGIYGNQPALVIDATPTFATVHTGTAELTYEPADLTPLARIELGTRGYSTPSSNRFRVCYVVTPDGGRDEMHVQVGKRGEVETRASEVRKLAFAHWRTYRSAPTRRLDDAREDL